MRDLFALADYFCRKVTKQLIRFPVTGRGAGTSATADRLLVSRFPGAIWLP